MHSVTKIFRFEAAHFLPEHDGQCKSLHGHSYKVEVTFLGSVRTEGPQNGMVVDFGLVSKFWKANLEPRLDHQLLNETVHHTPTAETLASEIWGPLEAFATKNDVRLANVRVWETDSAYAEYSGYPGGVDNV